MREIDEVDELLAVDLLVTLRALSHPSSLDPDRAEGPWLTRLIGSGSGRIGLRYNAPL
jgi:hypothetical protein